MTDDLLRSSKKIDISVVIPVFNIEAAYLDRALLSVAKQDADSVEALILDDGSDENHFLIYQSIVKRYDFARLIRLNHAGVSSARNKGIELARGEYISFLDSDDELINGALSTMRQECSGADIIIGEVLTLYPSGRKKLIGPTSSEELGRQDGLVAFFHKQLTEGVWGKLFKRDIILNLKFNESLSICEDANFLFLAICNSESIRTAARPCYRYIIRKGSSSNDMFNQKYFDTILSAKLMVEHVRSMKDSKQLINVANRYLISKCLDCYRTLARRNGNDIRSFTDYKDKLDNMLKFDPVIATTGFRSCATRIQQVEYVIARYAHPFYRMMINLFDKIWRS